MISGRSYRLVVATLIYQLLNLESCQGQINGLSKDELKGAKPCKYKVWFLEICDDSDKMQLVHLILEDGDMSCDITKHVREPCTPSKENDHPIMPKNAIFKDLLLSENHTKLAIEKYLNQTDLAQVPLALLSNSSQRENAIQVLIKELDIFEKQEDKTLHSHDPMPKDGHQHEKYRKRDSSSQSKVVRKSETSRRKTTSSKGSSENPSSKSDSLLKQTMQGLSNETQDPDDQELSNNGDYSEGSIPRSKNRPRFEKAQFPVRSFPLERTRTPSDLQKGQMILLGANREIAEGSKPVNETTGFADRPEQGNTVDSQDLFDSTKSQSRSKPSQNTSDSESLKPRLDSASSGSKHKNDSDQKFAARMRSTVNENEIKDSSVVENFKINEGKTEIHGRVVIDGAQENIPLEGSQFIKGQGNFETLAPVTEAKDKPSADLSEPKELNTTIQQNSILELFRRTRPQLSLRGQSDDLQFGPQIPIMLGDPRFKHPSMKVRIEAERVKQEDESRNNSNIEQKLMKFISAANLDIPGDDLVKIQTLLKHINSSVASDDEKRAMLDIVKEMENTIRLEMEDKVKSKEPEKKPRTISNQNMLKDPTFQQVPPPVLQQTLATSPPDPRRPNTRPEVQQIRRVNDLVQEVRSLTDTLSGDLGLRDQMKPREGLPAKQYYPNKEKLLESLRANGTFRNNYSNGVNEPPSKPDPYRVPYGSRSLNSYTGYKNYKTSKPPYEKKEYKKTSKSTKYPKKPYEKNGSTSEHSDSDKSFFEGPRWKAAPINASKGHPYRMV